MFQPKDATKIQNILFEGVALQSIPFEILSVGDLYQRFSNSKISISTPHRIQFHAILVVTSGNSSHTIDFKQYPLNPGVIVPLTKGQVHSFHKKQDIDGTIISFSEDFIINNISEKNLFHFLQLYHEATLQIDKKEIEQLNPYFKLLQETQQNIIETSLKVELLHAQFMSLLLQIKSLSRFDFENLDVAGYKIFLKFKSILANEYFESHNANHYAQKIGISYKHLNQVCKAAIGKTAKVFIDEWLLLETKRILIEKRYSSQEIAYKIGFKEHSNFIRFFKKYTGTTPKKYQEK